MNRRSILTVANAILPTLGPAAAIYPHRDAVVLWFSNNPGATFLFGLLMGLSVALPFIALISGNPPYSGEQK